MFSISLLINNSIFSKVNGDEFEENNEYKCLVSLLRIGLLSSKDSPEERPTMRDVVIVLESLEEDLVANAMASRKLRPGISNLLGDINATRNITLASEDKVLPHFSL